MSSLEIRLASMPQDKQMDVLGTPAYLINILEADALEELLTNFDFLEAKATYLGIQSIINDYELTLQTNLDFSEETKDSLSLIRDTLRLSSDALTKDITQFAAQLLGRLLHFTTPEIKMLLTQVKQKSDIKLYPISSSLTMPGGAMLRTLVGHTDRVEAVVLAYTSSGIQIVSGSWDKSIKVWDLQTGQEIRTLSEHLGRVWSVAVTPNNKQIVSGSQDKSIKVWDLQTGREILTLTGHDSCVSSVVITPDGSKIISGSWDKSIKVWDLTTGQNLLTLIGHTEEVNAVAVTPDGSKIVSASNDKTLKVWNSETGKELFHINSDTGVINDVVINSDCTRIISASNQDIGSRSATVKIWSLQNGELLQSLDTDAFGWINELAVTITPKENQIISGSGSNAIKIWDSDYISKTLLGHSEDINALVATNNDEYLISGSSDNTLKIWSLQKQKEVYILPGHRKAVRAIAVSPDCKKAVSASYGELKIWSLRNGKELITLSDIELSTFSPSTSFQIFTDSQRIIAISKSYVLKVWNLENGKELLNLEGHKDDILAVAVSPDCKKAVSSSDDKTIKVWDLESGRNLFTISNHTERVTAVAITPDSNKFVSASWDKTIKVWDLQKGIELITISKDGSYDRIREIAITLDGKSIVSSGDYGIKVWNLESGQELIDLTNKTSFFNSIPITPDSKNIISRSENREDDTTLKVWDLNAGGSEILTLALHSQCIQDVAVSANSQYAVSASEDHSLIVWDLQNGQKIAAFNGDNPLDSCAISPDGSIILAGEVSGQLHFLRFNPDGSELYNQPDLLLGEWQQVQDLFNQGLKLFKSRKYEEAINIFEQVTEINSNFYQAWRKKGEALSRLECYRDACRAFFKAYDCLPAEHEDRSEILILIFIAKDEFETQVHDNILSHIEEGGDVQEGIDALTSLLEDFSDNFAEGYALRGYLRNQVSDYQGAIEDYHEAIELKSELAGGRNEEYNQLLANAYYNQGVYLHQSEQYSQAIESYTNAIELDSLLDCAYIKRGAVYAYIDKRELAIADLQKAAEISLNQGDLERHKILIEYIKELTSLID